jgi:tetratricopeptide (TPR) repeat protein
MRRLADDLSPDIIAATEQALSLLAAGDAKGALAITEQLAQALPGSSLPSHLIGLVSVALAEPGKALKAFNLAHELGPEVREHAEALGIVHAHLGRVVDSLYFGKLATAATLEIGVPGLLPDWLGTFKEAFFAMKEAPLLKEAAARREDGDLAAAETLYRKATEVEPRAAAPWRGLARTLLALGRALDAVEAAARLVEADEAGPADRSLYAEALGEAGRIDEALGAHRRVGAMTTDDPAIAFALVRTLARRPMPDDATLASAAAAFRRRFEPGLAKPPRPAAGELRSRRLRLAVLSSRWLPGDGLDLVAPVLRALDPRLVELFVYAAEAGGSPIARVLRGRADHWHDMGPLDDDTVSFMLRNDAPDVVIDLDGPTRCARPVPLLSAAAPLALTLNGLSGAASALGLDGVVAGPNAPAGAGLVLRLQGGALALPVDLPRPLEGERPSGGPPVFGTLSAWGGVGGEAAQAWAEILHAIPGATLRLEASSLGGLRAAGAALDRFEDLAPPGSVHVVEMDELAYLGSVDLLLESPANPHPDAAVAATALGVPVVTARRGHPRGTLLADWLDRIGLQRLALADLREMVGAMPALAAPEALTAVRARLATAIPPEREHGARFTAERLVDALAAALVA